MTVVMGTLGNVFHEVPTTSRIMLLAHDPCAKQVLVLLPCDSSLCYFSTLGTPTMMLVIMLTTMMMTTTMRITMMMKLKTA